MCDEIDAYLVLRNISSDHFEIVNLSDTLSDANVTPVSNYVSPLAGSPMHSFSQSNNNSRWMWDVHSKELILSISLLAMADHLICTFSSNICRLAVLLRGDRSANFVHSLDLPEWFPN